MAHQTPNDLVLIALARLENVPEWKTVEAWLEQLLAKQDQDNRKLSGEAVYRGQGSAQTLAFLIEQSQKAKKTWRDKRQYEQQYGSR